MLKRFSLRFSLFLLFSDIALVVFALLLSTRARVSIPLGVPAPGFDFALPAPVYVIAPLIWVITFIATNIYEPKHTVRLVNELQLVVQTTVFAWLLLAGLLYMTYRNVSRVQMIYFIVFLLALICTHRVVLRAIFKLRGGRRYANRRVLIVGSGPIGQDVARMVQSHVWAGLYLVGFVADDTLRTAGDGDNAALIKPVLGPLDATLDIVEQHQISEVIIALPAQAQRTVRTLMYDLQWLPINIRLVPDYFDLAFLHVQVEDFGGMPLLSLKEASLTPFQRLTKRIFDIILTGLAMVAALPLMGLIAIAIKRDSSGPALLKQARIGEGGLTFKMYKFRTMVVDADKRLSEVITHDDAGNIIHKQANDPRVTPVGHLLRRLSLDELPQLFNVLRGEMSLVGPRPEMPWLVDKYEPWQRKRFEVPQGLTGWWQISGRADKPMHLHTEEDLFYIRNYSLWLDIQIIWRTIGVVLSKRGAY